jgi:Cdc6-like AAA superfamily ATPase
MAKWDLSKMEQQGGDLKARVEALEDEVASIRKTLDIHNEALKKYGALLMDTILSAMTTEELEKLKEWAEEQGKKDAVDE